MSRVQKLTKKEIEYYINNNKPVVFRDYKLPKENEEYYVEVLKYFLEHIGKEKISDYLGYCLREILNNAKKANTKRVFFIDQNLDINNIEHYNKGIKIFNKPEIPIGKKCLIITIILFFIHKPHKNNIKEIA